MSTDLGGLADDPHLYLHLANKLAQGNQKHMLRLAAEAAWLAVTIVADKTACRLPPPRLRTAPIAQRQPHGGRERGRALHRLEVSQQLPRGTLTKMFRKLEKDLHGVCFYEGGCRRQNVITGLALAKNYIGFVLRLLPATPRGDCP